MGKTRFAKRIFVSPDTDGELVCFGSPSEFNVFDNEEGDYPDGINDCAAYRLVRRGELVNPTKFVAEKKAKRGRKRAK